MILCNEYVEKYIGECSNLVYLNLDSNVLDDENNKLFMDTEAIIGTSPKMLSKIEKFKNLKWLQVTSAGYEHVDIDKIKKMGVTITNASGAQNVSIAEDVFCKIFIIARSVRQFEVNRNTKKWVGWDEDINSEDNKRLKTIDIYGKKMGILGAGAIAKEVGKRAKAFGMEVTAYARSKRECEEFDKVISTKEELNNMYKECDILVSCIPFSKETDKMLDYPEFELMKDGVIFVNISRGGIVNEEALIDALEKGKVLGAGLDVFEVEPLPKENKLWNMDNVYITSHKAGNGDTWMPRLKEIINDNIARFTQGKELINVI